MDTIQENRTLTIVALGLSGVALLLAGAIAGFFYAYASSVMRGLDAVPPAHAIVAMQGINAMVRNAVFAPAFFGTPIAATLAGAALLGAGRRAAGLAMLAAAASYLLGAFLPTFAINVPMNEALAIAAVPDDAAEAARYWRAYSVDWTWWNTLRTAFSLLCLALVGFALFLAGRSTNRVHQR
ncbi:MAG TPA: anthrone oxygenase family protein [Mesorhizobium sp.]|jgi:uncharacterized membrane protein|uniref:anthrone oxygenase family protein n=1 Tax=Mesorhizobium sp. TaxID=1871066 RepID=UPI002DDD1DF9|nr:anthrone oxygenase family protein [Mesorhizobium sp.]HEV2507529.1 anthrone oxygenase family protein [Mesorhizobium sp.]